MERSRSGPRRIPWWLALATLASAVLPSTAWADPRVDDRAQVSPPASGGAPAQPRPARAGALLGAAISLQRAQPAPPLVAPAALPPPAPSLPPATTLAPPDLPAPRLVAGPAPRPHWARERLFALRLGWPRKGEITSFFGEVGQLSPHGHAGIDIAANWGDPVVAAAAGTVARADWDGAYGLNVVLVHEDGTITRYGHLADLWVRRGERVEGGQLLGHVGSTGYSTGPHLHFEVHRDGALVDPLVLLPPRSRWRVTNPVP